MSTWKMAIKVERKSCLLMFASDSDRNYFNDFSRLLFRLLDKCIQKFSCRRSVVPSTYGKCFKMFGLYSSHHILVENVCGMTCSYLFCPKVAISGTALYSIITLQNCVTYKKHVTNSFSDFCKQMSMSFVLTTRNFVLFLCLLCK